MEICKKSIAFKLMYSVTWAPPLHRKRPVKTGDLSSEKQVVCHWRWPFGQVRLYSNLKSKTEIKKSVLAENYTFLWIIFTYR